MQQISKSHMPNYMNTKATNQEVEIQPMQQISAINMHNRMKYKSKK